MDIETLDFKIKSLPTAHEEVFVTTLKAILRGPIPPEKVSLIYKILTSSDQVCLTRVLVAEDSFEKNMILETFESNNVRQWVCIDLNVRAGIHQITWTGFDFISRHVYSKHKEELQYFLSTENKIIPVN